MHPQRIEPGPGQESVWDYPRPPALEDMTQHIQVLFNGAIIAETHRAKRVLETSHPPSYYIPPEDIVSGCLQPTCRSTVCEWKGTATYFSVVVGDRRAENAAWSYPNPSDRFASLQNHVAFYPSAMAACYVDGELVQAQAGDFYGGWVTEAIVGPFKGGAGTWGW